MPQETSHVTLALLLISFLLTIHNPTWVETDPSFLKWETNIIPQQPVYACSGFLGISSFVQAEPPEPCTCTVYRNVTTCCVNILADTSVLCQMLVLVLSVLCCWGTCSTPHPSNVSGLKMMFMAKPERVLKYIINVQRRVKGTGSHPQGSVHSWNSFNKLLLWVTKGLW